MYGDRHNTQTTRNRPTTSNAPVMGITAVDVLKVGIAIVAALGFLVYVLR